MGAIKVSDTFDLNLKIIKQCREQMGFTLEEVGKKIKSIGKIENGKQRPTYKQLATIASLYEVPEWVFVSDKLPEEYQYTNKLSFRMFDKQHAFESPKVRSLTVRIEQYRDLFVELRQDIEAPVLPFDKPKINHKDIKSTAKTVRSWLSIRNDEFLDFPELKNRVENKDIFIFLTSKFPSWAKIDQEFRGLAIADRTMPIIIINNSDNKKAQSFTLMHELGHILRGNTAIDGSEEMQEILDLDSNNERWCDRFAGEFLMPDEVFLQNNINSFSLDEVKDLDKVKDLANLFNVSAYACLVRLKQLNKISQSKYNQLNNERKQETEGYKQKSKGGSPRNRSKETSEQFGLPFIRTVLTAWHSQEITLNKATHILNLKQPKHFLDLENYA